MQLPGTLPRKSTMTAHWRPHEAPKEAKLPLPQEVAAMAGTAQAKAVALAATSSSLAAASRCDPDL
jgi:hypothetical protein